MVYHVSLSGRVSQDPEPTLVPALVRLLRTPCDSAFTIGAFINATATLEGASRDADDTLACPMSLCNGAWLVLPRRAPCEAVLWGARWRSAPCAHGEASRGFAGPVPAGALQPVAQGWLPCLPSYRLRSSPLSMLTPAGMTRPGVAGEPPAT
jgi:hypothetical protein